MKLMDKIKDLFMDEVIDDDEIELEEEEKEEYKEPPKEELPKVMRETIEKEEKVELRVKPEEFIRPKKEEVKEEKVEEEVKPKKFNFPIDFEEEVTVAEKQEAMPVRNKKVYDFDEEFKNNNFGNGNINVLNLEKETSRKVAELYPKKEEDIKPKFKASPVISPVYGILDKNYTKEEVREKDEETMMKRPSKKVDFETVRKKAFGNLADEIKDNMLCENCELYKEVKKISSLKEDDLLYEMTVDEDKDVTIEKAYDNYEEFGVAYEPKPPKRKTEVIPEEDEEEEEKPTSLEEIIKNNNALKEETSYTRMDDKLEEEKEEVTEVSPEVIAEEEEEVPSRSEKKKETKVDDDFFELIDSMYKERTDD